MYLRQIPVKFYEPLAVDLLELSQNRHSASWVTCRHGHLFDMRYQLLWSVLVLKLGASGRIDHADFFLPTHIQGVANRSENRNAS